MRFAKIFGHLFGKHYLHITKQRICSNNNCGQLVPMQQDLCIIHQGHNTAPTITGSKAATTGTSTATYTPFTLINEHTIIDAEGKPFDVDRVIKYVKCNEHVIDDGIKHQIVQDLVIALKKAIQYDENVAEAIEGLIQYRLLAPTSLQVPYRADDISRNKLNKLQKIQFYHQKQWNRLMDLIDNEQYKHDQRELRRINNKEPKN